MNERPAYFGIAVCMGMALAGGIVVRDAYAGGPHPFWWWLYPSIGVTGFGITVTLVGLGKAASWAVLEVDNWRARQLPPAVEAEPDDDEPTNPTDAETEAMRLAVEIWFRAGDNLGSFSENNMTGAEVCGSDVWPRLAGFYCSELGHQVLRVVPGNVGTTWNHGHNLDSTLLGLASGRLPLPPGNVPTVKPFIAHVATQRGAPRKSTAKPRVVDAAPSRAVAE